MRLCHPPDGSTSPKYRLLCFITTKIFCKEKNTLAFNRDRCCHLVLCLQLIPFYFWFFGGTIFCIFIFGNNFQPLIWFLDLLYLETNFNLLNFGKLFITYWALHMPVPNTYQGKKKTLPYEKKLLMRYLWFRQKLFLNNFGLMDHLHWRSLQSETISDSNMRQSLLCLTWPPWAMRQEIETILSVLCRPRWPRQV